jgi:hypothetical protein
MKRARCRALIGIVAVAIATIAAVALFAPATPRPLPARSAGQRPTLLLLTSLPLVFGEGFSLHEAGSPALKALQSRYRVVPISITDPPELAKGRLLLMAHPQAQPAEDLVALDQWVRRGGRVHLLADPMLEWLSKRPLGDLLRPPPMFTDTGLLAHWGLRLDSPEQRGPRVEKLGGFKVATVSPGELFGRCRISADRLVADCAIGRGRAIVVADADFLDVARLGGGGDHNLDALLAELAILEQP